MRRIKTSGDDAAGLLSSGYRWEAPWPFYLAAADPPAAVVTISAPVRIRPLLASATRVASKVMPVVPVLVRLVPRDADVRPYWSPYSRIPLVAAGQLELLLAETRRVLPQVRVPLLVVQGRRDWIIPRDSADEILRLAADAPATMLWLQRSGHVATLDRDRTLLADAVTEFLRVHVTPYQVDSHV